jgi:hypothetical protein
VGGGAIFTGNGTPLHANGKCPSYIFEKIREIDAWMLFYYG